MKRKTRTTSSRNQQFSRRGSEAFALKRNGCTRGGAREHGSVLPVVAGQIRAQVGDVEAQADGDEAKAAEHAQKADEEVRHGSLLGAQAHGRQSGAGATIWRGETLCAIGDEGGCVTHTVDRGLLAQIEKPFRQTNTRRYAARHGNGCALNQDSIMAGRYWRKNVEPLNRALSGAPVLTSTLPWSASNADLCCPARAKGIDVCPAVTMARGEQAPYLAGLFVGGHDLHPRLLLALGGKVGQRGRTVNVVIAELMTFRRSKVDQALSYGRRNGLPVLVERDIPLGDL